MSILQPVRFKSQGSGGSAGRLHIVVVEAWVEVRCQRAADNNDTGREAVVAAMQDVPDEHGGGQSGQ